MKSASPQIAATTRARLLVLAAAGVLLAGCATEPIPAVAPPPPSTDVTELEAWRDAELITGLSRDRFTLIGSGRSMLPIYGENTVLVVVKIDYTALRRGMQVAYVAESGNRVLHVLVEQDPQGWRVQGLNNETEDHERVTPFNLIGVVYASFTTNGGQKQ
ncbi:MAG: S24/S26 family peptidase [Verrucomicrobiota bacterium]